MREKFFCDFFCFVFATSDYGQLRRETRFAVPIKFAKISFRNDVIAYYRNGLEAFQENFCSEQSLARIIRRFFFVQILVNSVMVFDFS